MYDSRLGRWLSVDALAVKYPSYSVYNFALNSPVLLIDPGGNEVIVHDKASVKQMLQGLSPKDLKYIKFNKDGSINKEKISKLKKPDATDNYSNLREMVNSNVNYNLSNSQTIVNAKSGSNEKVMEDVVYRFGQVIGTMGVTLDSDESAMEGYPVTKDNCEVWVLINPSLKWDINKVTTVAHELYGHAYFYELREQGGDVNPWHEYSNELVYSDGEVFPEFLRVENNSRLIDHISRREQESMQNLMEYASSKKAQKQLDRKVKQFEKKTK